SQEIRIKTGKEEATVKFFRAYADILTESLEAHKNVPYGWVTKEGGEITGFVYGGRRYNKDGTESPAGGDPDILDRFHPYGKKATWHEALKLITGQQRIALEAIVAASFGSPLLRFTGKYSVMLAACSQTGTNKSTAVDIANAVWGNPKRIKGGQTSSLKAMMNQMAKTHNLPLYWDDVKNKKMMSEVCDFIDVAAEGNEGQKLKSNRTVAITGDWQSLLIVCANESVWDATVKRSSTNAASLYRVFELTVPDPTDDDPGRVADS